MRVLILVLFLGLGAGATGSAVEAGPGATPPVLWSQSDGYGTGWRVGAHPRLLADVDGDRREDLVSFGDAGVYLSLSTGTAFAEPRLSLQAYGNNDRAGGWRPRVHPRFLADVDRDGRKDIVGFGDDGVHVSLSTGEGFGTPQLWVSAYGATQGWQEDRHPRVLADVDGDGRDDVVGFGEAGVYVSLSTGTAFTEPGLWVAHYGYSDSAGAWRAGLHPRLLADVDGDGRKDLVGFRDASLYVSLSRGRAFDTPESWIGADDFPSSRWIATLDPLPLRDISKALASNNNPHDASAMLGAAPAAPTPSPTPSPKPKDNDYLLALKALGKKFEQAGKIYSSANQAYQVAKFLGEFIGAWPQEPNPFDEVINYIETATDAISWQATKTAIHTYRTKAHTAMLQLWRITTAGGNVAELSETDTNSLEAAVGLTLGGVENPAFERKYSAHAIGWLVDYIPKEELPQPNPVTNSVYDWRMGLPALMELISYRLHIIASMDKNYRWNGWYDPELLEYRIALERHYEKMLDGVKCGSNTCRTCLEEIVCADVHTGTHNTIGQFRCDPDLEEDLCVEWMKSAVRQRMPLFEMRSLIDTLNLYISGKQDLTDAYGDIRPEPFTHLCVESDEHWFGYEFTLEFCDGGDSQAWRYDRNTSTIFNSSLERCLAVKDSLPFPLTRLEPHECNDSNAQRWTYNPDDQHLLNGLGTALWHGLAKGESLFTYSPIDSITEEFAAPQTCVNVCDEQGPINGNACNQPCADAICAVNPYCCQNAWDSTCVAQVSSICELKCGP